jgi:cytochrome c5
MAGGKKWLWVLWFILSIGLAGYFALPLVTKQDQGVFLMGETTQDHHQIELECAACHTGPFGGKEVLQSACVSCHGDELKAVNDSHPKAKFTNPRNADRVKALDARYCVTCHVEHRLDKTHAMGVTLPTDFCFECHQDVAETRLSHEGLDFESCASSGCHNFHDNMALYEDFLLEHAKAPMFAEVARVIGRNAEQFSANPHPSLQLNQADAGNNMPAEIAAQWQHSSHAEAGVNCSGCHAEDATSGGKQGWVEHPGQQVCASCHSDETEGFLAGKHGMRVAMGLSPMTVAAAKIPMHQAAAHKELSCNSCHAPHSADTKTAAVEACVGCHASEHVSNFKRSPHAQIAEKEGLHPDEVVTCATCHMPRIQAADGRVRVQHNQNANLRPNEKMIRGVCMSCHSLAFSIDALADPELIKRNFKGQPSVHIESIDMAVERDEKKGHRSSVYN